jgi:hypothetical protein
VSAIPASDPEPITGSRLASVQLVGHDDLVTTARTYTHVVADEGELDYPKLLA